MYFLLVHENTSENTNWNCAIHKLLLNHYIRCVSPCFYAHRRNQCKRVSVSWSRYTCFTLFSSVGFTSFHFILLLLFFTSSFLRFFSLDLIHVCAQGSILLFEFITHWGSAVWWKEKGLRVTLSVCESFPQLPPVFCVNFSKEVTSFLWASVSLSIKWGS